MASFDRPRIREAEEVRAEPARVDDRPPIHELTDEEIDRLYPREEDPDALLHADADDDYDGPVEDDDPQRPTQVDMTAAIAEYQRQQAELNHQRAEQQRRSVELDRQAEQQKQARRVQETNEALRSGGAAGWAGRDDAGAERCG
ncbi:hypothetical protein ACWGID_36770 [Kribbella sp. NPDC054772]